MYVAIDFWFYLFICNKHYLIVLTVHLELSHILSVL